MDRTERLGWSSGPKTHLCGVNRLGGRVKDRSGTRTGTGAVCRDDVEIALFLHVRSPLTIMSSTALCHAHAHAHEHDRGLRLARLALLRAPCVSLWA